VKNLTTCIWFDTQAEEAAHFYVNLFTEAGHKGTLGQVMRYGKASEEVSGKPAGSVMTAVFELDGQEFMALNGGTHFTLSGAISFIITCETQKEIDLFWNKLSEGGEAGQCGWINKDKFGVTWQITPSILPKLLSNKNKQKSEAAMKAMLGMTKLDIATLQKAFDEAGE